MFNDHRILLMNITRNYKTSDEKIRQYIFRAKIHVPCPLKLHRDALGSTIDKAFENQGATRVLDRVDCDVDFEDPSKLWIENVVSYCKSI